MSEPKVPTEERIAALEARLAESQTDLALAQEQLRSVVEVSETRRRAMERARREALTAQHKAEQAAEARTRFIANVSHELRTPLHGILGLAQVMERDTLPSELRAALEAQEDCAHQLAELVEVMLEVAEGSENSVPPSEELSGLQARELPLRDWLVRIAHELRPQALAKGLSFAVEFDLPERLLVRIDPYRLRRALVALLDNAIAFTTAGEVRLRAAPGQSSEGAKSLLLSVSDTGRGVPAERLEYLMQPFTQGDESHRRSHGGLGVGLSLARRTALAHGGQFEARSWPGQGSRFSLSLPWQKCVSGPSTAPPERSPNPRSASDLRAEGQGLSILLVEDNALNQRVAKTLLERNGHRVQVAKDGQAGVEAWRQDDYQLILMDLQMPRMDGFEATRLIRSHPEGQSVPILAVSANLSPEIRMRCREVGMNAALDKPFRWPELERIIHELTAPAHAS